MLQNIGLNLNNNIFAINNKKKSQKLNFKSNLAFGSNVLQKTAKIHPNTVLRTKLLSSTEFAKYNYLTAYLSNIKPGLNSEGLTPIKQLESLLKSGKLLALSNNDSSTTLDNLYDIATEPRAYNLENKRVLTDTLDLLVNPRYVTQNFGDIPSFERQNILAQQDSNSEVLKDNSLMDVTASGTCAAASNEVNLADKYPADFARWVSKLSNKEKVLTLNVDMDSISKNKLDAIAIMNIFNAKIDKFNFKKNNINVTLDNNAYLRALIQNKYWDKGERNIADVLVQSAIMQIGSQGTYDSLLDTRAATFNDNNQGLVEIEKTYVESLIKNKEITSLVYQKVDDNQNLVGYTCSFDKIKKHITDAIDSGNNVILGYVLTNETSGQTALQNYNPQTDGAPNKIINGHEITIVDYYIDENGKINFICIDTDDDTSDFARYNEDWLLPKIHHAGYPSELVKDDEKEIMANL